VPSHDSFSVSVVKSRDLDGSVASRAALILAQDSKNEAGEFPEGGQPALNRGIGYRFVKSITSSILTRCVGRIVGPIFAEPLKVLMYLITLKLSQASLWPSGSALA
jgi:hypothetical protein